MKKLKMHTIDTAPQESRSLLQSSIDNFGWIPFQSAYMAESPNLLASYQFAHDSFSNSSLNEDERAIVWITTGKINRCEYTVQAHLWIALKKGVSPEILKTLIENPNDLTGKYSALYNFTHHVVLAQGQIANEAITEVLKAGFNLQNVLDVILGVSQKTMSTLLNSIAQTKIESQFQLKETK